MSLFWHDGRFDTETAIRLTENWVRTWQRRLWIPEWEVHVGITPPEDHTGEHLASCNALPEYMYATIQLNPIQIWEEQSERDCERVVLHELCHLVTARTRSIAYDRLAESELELTRLVWQELSAADEEAVERIARQTWNAYATTGGPHGTDVTAS